jgi:hypothetical protein
MELTHISAARHNGNFAMGVRFYHLITAVAVSAVPFGAAHAQEDTSIQRASDNRFAIFTPTADPIRHRIDYEVYDFALKNLVIAMGPSTRSRPFTADASVGTRRQQGHNSRYRLEGSMVGFSFFNTEVTESLGEYRRELEEVGSTLDIAMLPRNEQLAYWFNLHNVAMLEFIAREWPVRQPREIMVDGVPLDDAPTITVRGVTMSLRDIRENIVFANWRNPKVIYGFWRGEIGGPALEREAYNGANVGSLLDVAAEDFVNSLRGTQKNGDTLEVSTLYQDAARFYFPNFEADLRTHIAAYANDEVTNILARTHLTRASIREWDIADLSGGSRGANYLASSRPGLTTGAAQMLFERQRKLDTLERQEVPTGRVIFSNIDLPGDPPNKNAVE